MAFHERRTLYRWFGDWRDIAYDFHVLRRFRPADEFENSHSNFTYFLKEIVFQRSYTDVFGTVQWILRHNKVPDDLHEGVGNALQASRAAYRVFDRDTIVPTGSDAEAETFRQAFANVSASEFRGARAHLREAGSKLTAGDFPGSIRESIHAVEAIARTLEPGANTLDPALKKLQSSARNHPALGRGFGNLYGFTSDEKGIRHPLLDEPAAAVDETDALYMLGSCAAFVSYLINKARSAGLMRE
jgi:hypothetical protein